MNATGFVFKGSETLFCCSFVIKQVTVLKLAATGVILEAGDNACAAWLLVG